MNGRRLNEPNPLHDHPDSDWGVAFEMWRDAQLRDAMLLAPKNEVRWGNVKRFTLHVPSSSVLEVATEFDQIVNIEAPARCWCLSFTLTWEDQAKGAAGETMTADLLYNTGVGSARGSFAATLSVAQAAPVNFATVVTPMFPAGTIYGSCRARFTPVSGAGRDYHATITVLAAPVVR